MSEGFVSIQPDKSLIVPQRWLWKPYISEGGLALLVGNEEVGKGVFAVHVMSKLATGKLFGNYYGKPIRCAVVAYEDSAGEWNKRMDAAGVPDDMWEMIVRPDGSMLDFTKHAGEFIKHLKRQKVRFVYFDQLKDHMGIVTDNNNSKQVREAMLPVHHAFTDTTITALATDHPNKKGSTEREKVNGSVSYLAIVRSALYVAKHPDDEEARVVLPIKNNRGPRGQSLEFEIESTDHTYRPNGRYIDAPVISSLKPSRVSFDDLVSHVGGTRKRGDVVDGKLKAALADGEWHWYSDLVKECGLEEYGFKVLARCFARIGTERDKKGYPARSRYRSIGGRKVERLPLSGKSTNTPVRQV